MTSGINRISTPARPAPQAFAVLLLLLVTVLAAAQADAGPDSEANAKPSAVLSSSGYSQDHQDQILELFERASDAEVPNELLIPRLQEGLAKRVDAAQMIGALDRDLANLQETRAIMTSVEGAEPIHGDQASWARATNLLSAGQSPETLRLLVEYSLSRPEAFRQATLLYLAVSEWGVEPELALELTHLTTLSDIEPDDYPLVAELFAVGQRSRLSPDEIFDRISAALSEGLSVGQIRRLFER